MNTITIDEAIKRLKSGDSIRWSQIRLELLPDGTATEATMQKLNQLSEYVVDQDAEYLYGHKKIYLEAAFY